MKKVVSRTKKRMMLSLGASLGLFQLATSNVSAAIGDNASKLANTAQSEALGVAEAVGLVGIVICGLLMFVGQREIAKKLIIGVVAGYFILKYAQPIWNVVTGGI